jgi:hypothetical protein
MKKVSLQTILDTLTSIDFSDSDILDELRKEINKGAEQKAKNAAAYEAIHDIVIGVLGDAPATVSEIWDSIENEVPEGTTKGKVQYALNHLWQDEIIKIEGKPNQYRRNWGK